MTPTALPNRESACRIDSAGYAMRIRAAVMREELRTRMFGEAYGSPVMLGGHRLQCMLGHGGMGAVFAAIDERTRQPVALKVMHQGKGAARHQLKREFRALADLSHPNLVVLHELYLEGDAPFFTMELVYGEDLLSHLRPTGVLDHARLRAAMVQLIDAVSTLHGAGRLHRDLKPSNLLVRPNGRLVVLDFGLAHAIGEDGAECFGTPAYLAPERWLGGHGNEASDWYSVGVVLYEAFTGALPHPSTDARAMGDPINTQPLLTAGACPALATLISRLLSRSPGGRPAVADLRAQFGRHPASRVNLHPAPGNRIPFVGRELELRMLWHLFGTVEQGRAVVVRVHGEPGIGKTALVSEFLRRLASTGRAAILLSRCHEREYIPYNAVDGLIDAVVQYVQDSPPGTETELAAIEGAAELARLFPVLRRLPEFRALTLEESAIEPHRSQRRAFSALRRVLQQISTAQPLVVHFDDLQWGDADSAELLAHALGSPRLPRLMVIATYRTSDSSASCIRFLSDVAADSNHELALECLGPTESLGLAQQFAGGSLSQTALQALSGEAKGSPLFLHLLVQHQRQGRAPQPGGGLRRALRQLIDELPPLRRMLLEILAISGARLDRHLLLSAAAELGAPPASAEELYVLLQTGLVRTTWFLDARRLEPYHQRLAEAIIDNTDRIKSREYHKTLARTVGRLADPDHEFVAHHFEQASELSEAARFAELAGDRALAGLALERASQSYTQALRCLSGARPARLIAKAADALAYIGRCAEAAPLYLEAANSLAPEEQSSLKLRLHAAEMYMRMGETDLGSEVVRPVFRAIGLHYPITKTGAQLAFLSNLLRLRLRTGRPARADRTLSPKESLRADMCFELGRTLSLIAHPCPTSLLLRSLLIALEGGTDAQLARGFASYAWVLAALRADSEHHDRLLDIAWRHACRTDDADVRGWVLFCRAVVGAVRSEFRQSREWAERATKWIEKNCVDSGWLLTELECGPLTNLFLMGRIRELDVQSARALERARKQGNRLHADETLAHRAMVWLARDEVRESWQTLERILAAWEQKNFGKAPALAAAMQLHYLLYRGEVAAARVAVRRFARRYRSHGYMAAHAWAIPLTAIYASVSLTAAFANARTRPPRDVDRAIARLRRHPLRASCCAAPFADLLEAGRARLGGDLSTAIELYRRAAQRFDEVEMYSHAAAARVRQAELLSGVQALAIRRHAEDWAAREGIVNLDAWARMHAPGPT
jgi:eukaryotic-like serine/threonine-protein kinase